MFILILNIPFLLTVPEEGGCSETDYFPGPCDGDVHPIDFGTFTKESECFQKCNLNKDCKWISFKFLTKDAKSFEGGSIFRAL